MPRVVHVVVTDNFAGTERYVCNTANELGRRPDWAVVVVGGSQERMASELDTRVRWLPGGSPITAASSLRRSGRHDICHAHLTLAEGVALATRSAHQAPVVATRHFAAKRGSSLIGKAAAGLIGSRLERQFAVSEYVARHLERPPDAVIRTGVPPSQLLWNTTSRIALVMQRFEREKATLTALQAWHASGLAESGWSLRVVGAGSEQSALETWVRTNRVEHVHFAPWAESAAAEFRRAGLLLATAPREPFGLTVVEAMAAGVPVVAAAGGGHLETIGQVPDARLFEPGDADAAASALRSLEDTEARRRQSASARDVVEARFTVRRQVDQLIDEYTAISTRT